MEISEMERRETMIIHRTLKSKTIKNTGLTRILSALRVSLQMKREQIFQYFFLEKFNGPETLDW